MNIDQSILAILRICTFALFHHDRCWEKMDILWVRSVDIYFVNVGVNVKYTHCNYNNYTQFISL